MEEHKSSLFYPNGQRALVCDQDFCRFCYYPSGRIAVCISNVNEYQKRHYFYHDNVEKSLCCLIDEHAVGSAEQVDGMKLVLTKECGILSDQNNNLIKSWKWDSKAKNAGNSSQEPIPIQLNQWLTFTFTNRENIRVQFHCHNVKIEFDCGLKFKRMNQESYLMKATRIRTGHHRGKLCLPFNGGPTLVQRQVQIEKESLTKRNKKQPKSCNIEHKEIKSVIADLEKSFDNLGNFHVNMTMDPKWQHQVFLQTLGKIPKVVPTGLEVGAKPKRFASLLEEENNQQTASNNKKQIVGSSSELQGLKESFQAVASDNSILPRSSWLCNASGRYSLDLPQVGGKPIFLGKSIKRVNAQDLEQLLVELSSVDTLLVVACLREDDRSCRKAERVLEHVNEMIQSNDFQSEERKLYNIVKFEMSESRYMIQHYNVHALPSFLMFYHGKLVHWSCLGGEAVRVTPTTKNAHLAHLMDYTPKVFLLEPQFHHQIEIEKILKKEGFQWDLCLNAMEASSRIQSIRETSGVHSSQDSYGVVLISDTMSENEIRNLAYHFSKLDQLGTEQEACPLYCLMISSKTVDFAASMCLKCRETLGRRCSKTTQTLEVQQACPHCGIVGNALDIIPKTLISTIHVAVSKPIKSSTMHRLAEMWQQRKHHHSSKETYPTKNKYSHLKGLIRKEYSHHKGLTKEFLLQNLATCLDLGRCGKFLETTHPSDMSISVIETTCKGYQLSQKS